MTHHIGLLPFCFRASIFFLISVAARSMLVRQQKPHPTTRIATASRSRSTVATMVLWLAASTSTRLAQTLKGKQQVQIDCNCSQSPLATQLLVLSSTKMLSSWPADDAGTLHSISGGSSSITNSARKLEPTPIAQLCVKFEKEGIEWISQTPSERSSVVLGGQFDSSRTCRLMAQGWIWRSLSPAMMSLGLQSPPNLKRSLASSTQVQQRLSLRASYGLRNVSLKKYSATQLSPPSLQMTWRVDSYLLSEKQSADSSQMMTNQYSDWLGLNAMNFPSARAQYFPWSGMASVKVVPAGGGSSKLMVAFPMLLVISQTMRMLLQVARMRPQSSALLQWHSVNLMRSCSLAQAQSQLEEPFMSIGSSLKLLKFWLSTETSLTPSVTMILSQMTSSWMSRTSELFRPRELMLTFLSALTRLSLLKVQATNCRNTFFLSSSSLQLSLLTTAKTAPR